MNEFHRGSHLTSFIALAICLFCSSIAQAFETDPRTPFARQILIDIDDLARDTHSLELTGRQKKILSRQLKFASISLEKGIKRLRKGKEKKVSRRLKVARFFINSYQRALSHWVRRGFVESDVADPFLTQAKKIRSSLTQLIKGELGNSPPVANAGLDQSVETGQIVTLNGSASYDPDADSLTFQWMISRQPEDSLSVLDNDQAITPSFLADVAGNYEIQLVVDDGTLSSNPDKVMISVSAANSQPEAHAGSDKTGYTGDRVTLDGSASTDADGDKLSFNWSLIMLPEASSASLDDAYSLKPAFSADIEGRYEAELIVNDGRIDSEPDAVTINIESANTKPLADAGSDQSVATKQRVQLDGSASSDVDGDPLTWLWTLISKPVGSLAELDDELAVNPTFISDLAGQYIAQLIVNDGEDDSTPDHVLINVLTPNTIPLADAGADQSNFVGSLITLDGSASADADGDPLTYDWSLLSIPSGSQADLDNPSLIQPSFVLDIAGDYVAQLIVNDGQANSAPDTVNISTLNSRPAADAGPRDSPSRRVLVGCSGRRRSLGLSAVDAGGIRPAGGGSVTGSGESRRAIR